MSLYNAMFGANNNAAVLANMLGIDINQVSRLRDIYLSNERIIVFTRTGGLNREDFPNTYLEEHPLFKRTYDDDFDNTYAYYEFGFPEEHKEQIEAFIKENGADPTPSEKWDALFKAMEKASKREGS